MNDYEIAAVLHLAEFSSEDALVALDAACPDSPGHITGAMLHAGYPADEIGRGLKTVFHLRNDEMATAFITANGCAIDAMQALAGAYRMSLDMAARFALEAGYSAAEVERANADRRCHRAQPGETSARRPPRHSARWKSVDGASPIKIFIYDIPDELLFLGHDDPIWEHAESGRFEFSREMLREHYFSKAVTTDWTQQYGYEFLIEDQLRNSEHITNDPDAADFFLIPHFSTLALAAGVNQLGVWSQWLLRFPSVYLQRILDYLRSNHPYFDRRGGRDHLLICTWDNGVGLFHDPEIHRTLADVIQITYHGTRASRYFDTHPHIILPPFINNYLSEQVRADPRAYDFSDEQRQLLSFFFGSLRNHPMRVAYKSRYGNDPDMPANTSEMYTEAFDDIRFKSRFSICLEGLTPWTMRLSQAFMFGCVPVIVSDNIILPFERFIDWDECSIRVSSRQILNLKSILQNVTPTEMARLQQGLMKYSDAILYSSTYSLFNQPLGQLLLAELQQIKLEMSA